MMYHIRVVFDIWASLFDANMAYNRLKDLNARRVSK